MKWNKHIYPPIFAALMAMALPGCSAPDNPIDDALYEQILSDFTKERIYLHLYSTEVPPKNSHIISMAAARHGIRPNTLFHYMRQNRKTMFETLIQE